MIKRLLINFNEYYELIADGEYFKYTNIVECKDIFQSKIDTIVVVLSEYSSYKKGIVVARMLSILNKSKLFSFSIIKDSPINFYLFGANGLIKINKTIKPISIEAAEELSKKTKLISNKVLPFADYLLVDTKYIWEYIKDKKLRRLTQEYFDIY